MMYISVLFNLSAYSSYIYVKALLNFFGEALRISGVCLTFLGRAENLWASQSKFQGHFEYLQD